MTFPKKREIRLLGTVEPGFEEIEDLFAASLRTQAEVNAQLCIYVGERCVIDLCGSAVGDKNYSFDTISNVFSSGKSLESIALAWQVSESRLDYGARICDYWPEFSGDGKENLSIADLMRHEAGLSALNVSIEPSDLWRESIKANKLGELLAAHPLRFRADSPREYHALTRGWVANEIFRRVDPAGRTMGEFYRQDFCLELGAQVYIGLEESDLEKRSLVVPLSLSDHLRKSLVPRMMGRAVKHSVFELGANLLPMMIGMRDRSTRGSPVPFVGMDSVGYFNTLAIAKGETPSANAHASARSLARLAGVMACEGEWMGKRYLSESAWNAMHAEPVYRSMGMQGTFCQGGVAEFAIPKTGSSRLARSLNVGREGFYGWMGLGGSIFQWHPEKRIGFSFVPTGLHVLDILNERGKAFQSALVRLV